LVVERYQEALGGQVRANCDACVYRIALPGHEHRVGAPQRPHEHPHDTHPHTH
jgi:sirohydrochlorin cobaltochelatase